MSNYKYLFIKLKTKILIAFLLIIPIIFSACEKEKKAAPVQAQKPIVKVEKIVPEKVVLKSELPGRTTAYRVAGITPRVNGLILKRHFKEGSNVTEGSLLYQIDQAPLEATLEMTEASLSKAEANYEALRTKARRYRALLPSSAVSRQDYDDIISAEKQALADIKAYEAQIKSAKIDLGYARITAPISGRIGKSSVTEGAVVTAYQTTPLATIQQLDPIYVDVPQSTSELLRLKNLFKKGTINNHSDAIRKVGLILDDDSEYPFQGDLQFQDITVDETTGSVTLRIIFPNPNNDLLPNMFVRAVVKEGIHDQALLVPQLAVARDVKGNPYVMIVTNENKVAQQYIKIDRSIGDRWLITDGLKAGDRVVVSGLQKIRNGVPVTVMGEMKPNKNRNDSENKEPKPEKPEIKSKETDGGQ